VHAVETENHTTRILPAPGKVVVDGKVNDWDLSGGTFACSDVKRFRDHYGIWLHLMYDADNLYVLARWTDPTPLNNPQSSKGGYGFKGDCLQFRMIFNYEKADERVSHLTAWQDKDGVLMADIAYGRKFRSGKVPNITGAGGQHAMGLVEGSDNAYIQEIAIPWSLIAAKSWTPVKGATFRVTVEPNFTAGKAGRISVKDLLYNPLGIPDRIFTFRAYKDWAEATILDKGKVAPQPLVMASGDEFKVSMKDGVPSVDWSPLFVKKELPGHKAITFTMPHDGCISMVIKDKAGIIVRHLLNDVLYQKGTHTVKWDGLATPMWRTPTDVLPAGDYTWEAIVRKPYKLTLQGWVDCHGTPWTAGPTSSWGGDHGAPSAIAAYKDTMILAWSYSEAGYGTIAVTNKGKKIWHTAKGPTAGGPLRLVVDGDEVVGYDKNVFKFSAKDGEFGAFSRNGKAVVYAKELWKDAGAPKGEAFGSRPDSLDAHDGVIYLGFADAPITEEHIKDWKQIATYLAGDKPFALEVLKRLSEARDERGLKRYRHQLGAFAKGKIPFNKVGQHRSAFHTLPKKLSRYFLDRTDLSPESKGLTGMALRSANRTWISREMGDALKPLRKDFIVTLNKASGKVIGHIRVPAPTFIKAVSKDLLYVISDEKTILSVNPKSGKAKALATGEGFKSLTLDGDGNLVVAQQGDAHQVVVFSPKGKELRRIGKKGGRPALGPWFRDGLRNPEDLSFDSEGKLWVMEFDKSPKRISVWDYASGKNVDEFFGPTHYGASGACVNPVDPSIMISSGVEYKLDEDGRGHAQQVITPANDSTFTTYATPRNGRLYWVRSQMQHRETPQVIEIFEKLADGCYALRAAITRTLTKTAATTHFWSDRNGDQKRDEDEVQSIPLRLDMTGRWWLTMEARNLTLVAKASDPAVKGSATMKAFKVTSYTACGAPVWDVKNPQDLSYTHLTTKDGKKSAVEYQFGHMMPSLDNKFLLSQHNGARGGGSRASLECFDMASGKRLWWYPSQWNHVHGGHKAPPAEPGLLRATYGIIGQFIHPVVGNVWVLNTDKGEWHMVSEAGFHIGNLFNPDAMTRTFPDTPSIGADMTMAPPGSGGEDFGGSVIQAKNGEVYLQAGKVGAWRLALEGLDSIRRLGSGKVILTPNEIALAQKEYERQKQGAASKKIMEIEKKTVTFTGDPGKDFGRKSLSYKKAEKTRVTTWAAYDEASLYLAYTVYDPTPWVNGAGEAVALYQCGDTVDLQLGADPLKDRKRTKAAKGDLRLSIGNFRGKPTAVLYRKTWDEKKEREFTSGVIKSYIMDYVTVLDSAKIEVKVDHKKKLYTVEAAVPLKDLGLSPDKTALYKADFGVTHGDPAGERTQLRTHWSNQQTGLVDDAVFELMMYPQNWGEIKFK
jgi:hypothetical protein